MLNASKKLKGFTLIEILIWITLFSIIITSWFYAYSAVSLWKIKLIWKTSIEKESYFFSERLFEEIKKWWLLDYEEYFNRKVINTWHIWDEYWSWHYKYDTWFWNFWSGWILWSNTFWDYFYFCRSWIWDSENMSSGTINPSWWCYDTILNNYGTGLIWKPQRYWQYSFEFIDYNLNINSDSFPGTCIWPDFITRPWKIWDENCDWSIIWDDDDESLWIWPEVFSNTWEVQELYLISWNKKSRTIFRWVVTDDPNKPISASGCDFTSSNQKNPTWVWCLWTIEFLKLDLKDWGVNHDKVSSWTYDWSPDTWIINENFAWSWWIIAWSNSWSYRVSLFPKTINVKNVNFYLYPNKDLNLAWKDNLASSNFSPFLRIRYTLTPSREKRKWIKWTIPELNFSTTITLSDLFSNK